ncbi:hypothetical protein ACWEKT_07890 [Nocardia takedensis]
MAEFVSERESHITDRYFARALGRAYFDLAIRAEIDESAPRRGTRAIGGD